jgi:hypothetical protein
LRGLAREILHAQKADQFQQLQQKKLHLRGETPEASGSDTGRSLPNVEVLPVVEQSASSPALTSLSPSLQQLSNLNTKAEIPESPEDEFELMQQFLLEKAHNKGRELDENEAKLAAERLLEELATPIKPDTRHAKHERSKRHRSHHHHHRDHSHHHSSRHHSHRHNSKSRSRHSSRPR